MQQLNFENNYFFFFFGVLFFLNFCADSRYYSWYRVRFTGMTTVGLHVLLDANRTNKCAHVHTVRVHVCARSAMFVGTERVLPIPSQATRNFLFLRCSPAAVTLSFRLGCFSGLVRVGLKFPLNGNRANVYAHVVVVRKHVRRTLCSVCAYGARVAHPFPSNS